jgi:PRTRC genetic system protein F
MATHADSRPDARTARYSGTGVGPARLLPNGRALAAREQHRPRRTAQRGRKSSPPATASTRSAAELLGRARIASDVPVVLQHNPDRQIATLALLLFDAGLLPDEALQRRRSQLSNTCRESLEAWIALHCAGLRVFKPKVSLSVGETQNNDRTARDANQALRLQIEWYATDSQCLVIGPAVTQLEETHRGLGGTAMRAISTHSWCSIPVFTFDDQIDVASHTLWGGAESIDDHVQEYDLDTEEAVQMRESCIDRADILERTPQWVFSVRDANILKDRTLKRIARRSADPLCKAVASAILALRAAPEPYHYLRDAMENEGEFVGFGAVLRWRADDLTPTVLDGLWEQAQNSGEGFESCGFHAQAIDDVDALRQWITNLTAMFRVLKELDQLIASLVDFSNAISPP